MRLFGNQFLLHVLLLCLPQVCRINIQIRNEMPLSLKNKISNMKTNKSFHSVSASLCVPEEKDQEERNSK